MLTQARTIIIGDLHGCASEARALLRDVGVGPTDRVIFLGDLVDRGADSAACVDLAMEHEARQGSPACVLGNHEARHLSYRAAETKRGRVTVDNPDHVRTRSQLRDEHYGYMARMPRYIAVPEHGAACVHAGAWPGRPLVDQSDRHLQHIQMINPALSDRSLWPSKVPPGDAGWSFWATLWRGPERLVFGHSVLTAPFVSEHAVGLDGGACFGLELWAVVLPGWEIVRHGCSHLARRGRGARQPAPIAPGVGSY